METAICQTIGMATQLTPFKTIRTCMFPMGTKIKLDQVSPVSKKQHEIIYQQGVRYGTVGDMYDCVSQKALFKLAEDGYILLRTPNHILIVF